MFLVPRCLKSFLRAFWGKLFLMSSRLSAIKFRAFFNVYVFRVILDSLSLTFCLKDDFKKALVRCIFSSSLFLFCQPFFLRFYRRCLYTGFRIFMDDNTVFFYFTSNWKATQLYWKSSWVAFEKSFKPYQVESFFLSRIWRSAETVCNLLIGLIHANECKVWYFVLSNSFNGIQAPSFQLTKALKGWAGLMAEERMNRECIDF